jgi:formyltetrahydrofolate-dependent phosphoribosylglycinamide formyltransferase
VLVSGGGTTLQNLMNERAAGRLPIEIVLVISSRRKAYALERATRAAIPTLVLRPKAYADAAAYGDAIATAVRDARGDLVLMAGFLSYWRIPDDLLGRVLNIHPALLPAFGGKGFYGDRVHEAVLASGVRFSGCTVHFADNVYDHGPIAVQRVVPVHDDDTVALLRARVFGEECRAYPEAIRLLAQGRLKVEGRRVRIGPPAAGFAPPALAARPKAAP